MSKWKGNWQSFAMSVDIIVFYLQATAVATTTSTPATSALIITTTEDPFRNRAGRITTFLSFRESLGSENV